MLTNHLFVTPTGRESNAIAQSDVNKIKNKLSETATKKMFIDPTLAIYRNIFDFSNNSAMFNFKNNINATSATIDISLTMPINGLDLIYNLDKTVSFKVSPHAPNDNIVLTINKFANTTIIAKNIYFMPNIIVRLPKTIMKLFSTFLDELIVQEENYRTEMENEYKTLKELVDKTSTSGLSYWNAFALNFAISNVSFLKNDIQKSITDSGLYKFISTNAKLNDADLSELVTQVKISATNNLNMTPFVSSPAYSNLLFDTKNITGNRYSLSLNISNFTYEYKIDNLFNGVDALKVDPILTLSGVVYKTIQSPSPAELFPITEAKFNFKELINISEDLSTTTGGFVGFLDTLKDIPNDMLTTLTNGLVTFNDKSDSQKMDFWNNFSSNATIKNLILAELKKPDVLYNFVTKNIDLKSTYGMNTFPTIVPNTFKTSFNEKAKGLTTADLMFLNPDLTPMTLGNVKYGPGANDVFTKISIYFGYENNGLSKFNLTSTLVGSNMSFSQTIGTTTNLGSLDLIKTAAAKKVSVLFETKTGNANHIAYFGQKNVNINGNVTQVANPIIIPSTILTANTTFIKLIQQLI